MFEPVAPENFLIAFVTGALILLAGAGYAMAFAFSRMYRQPAWMRLAWVSFAVLTASVLTLSWVMNFTGYWLWLTAVMLIGYLLAPHAIWHLSVGTHKHPASEHNPTENIQ